MNKNTNKTKYIDGFVFVVAKNKVNAYKKMARGGYKLWMKYGALDYKECMIDDVDPYPEGVAKGLLFTALTNAKKGDTVWFSYITYKSKAHRNQVNKKVMAEMGELYPDMKDFVMPFDMNKMSTAGFKVMVG